MPHDINLVGWVKVRRGLIVHLQQEMTLNEFVVFHLLLALADKATGSGRINAAAIPFWTGSKMGVDAGDRALRGLEKKGYIVREITHGREGLYVFHVQKYLATAGADEGKMLTFTKNFNKIEKFADICEGFDVEPADETAEPAEDGGADCSPVGSAGGRGDDTRTENREGRLETGQLEVVREVNSDPTPTPSVSTKFDPIAYAKTLREDGRPEARPLVELFIQLSGHWMFKRGVNPKDREQCTKAFEGLLVTETPARIESVLRYTVANPDFGSGMKKVKNVYPWDWFVKRFDEIATHMDDEPQRAAKLKERAEKRASEVKDVKTAVKNASKPEYRKDDYKWL